MNTPDAPDASTMPPGAAEAGSAMGPAAAGFGALQAGLGIFSAISENRAIQSAIDNARREAIQRQGGASDVAGVRLDQANREGAVRLGRLRVLMGNGAGSEALVRQNAVDTERNRAVALLQYRNEVAAIRGGYRSFTNQAASQTVNPILAGVTGALGGAATGLSIGGAFDDMTESNRILQNLRAGGMP